MRDHPAHDGADRSLKLTPPWLGHPDAERHPCERQCERDREANGWSKAQGRSLAPRTTAESLAGRADDPGSPSETAISSSIEDSCGVAPPGRRRPSVWSGCKRRLPRMWRSAREQAPPPEHSRGGGWLRIGGGDGRCGSQGVQDAIGSTFDGVTWLGSAVVWARPRRNRPKRVLSGEARTGHAS